MTCSHTHLKEGSTPAGGRVHDGGFRRRNAHSAPSRQRATTGQQTGRQRQGRQCQCASHGPLRPLPPTHHHQGGQQQLSVPFQSDVDIPLPAVRPLAVQMVQALGLCFHEDHFQCIKCECSLADINFFAERKRPYAQKQSRPTRLSLTRGCRLQRACRSAATATPSCTAPNALAAAKPSAMYAPPP